jgi:gluconate 2-dehydrogenase alpha chain
MATLPRVDVVTVGAGWSAGIIAQQLTAAGYDVLSLEMGLNRFANPHFAHNHDTLHHVLRTGLMANIRKETWTWRPNPGAPSLPMRQFGSFHPGQGTGGAGIHWAAQHWRFYPTDFNYRTHHTERYGADKLPEGNRIQDWGITYEELEPYYTRVDLDIGVSGEAGNVIGAIQDRGNPFEPSRSMPYPLPPLQNSLAAEEFHTACRALGYHPFRQPAAILSQAYKDVSGRIRSGCLYCGFCTRYGCEVDAKASANASHIPLALATGRYEIRGNCRVIRINTTSNGLATGVTYIDEVTGTEYEQPADVVILSAFTLTNVRLLLLSASAQHPNGVGNDRSMVGRNYTYQLVKNPVTGVFEGRKFNLFMGNSCLQDVIHDFYGDNFDHSDLDFIGGAAIQAGGGEREPISSALNIMSSSATSGGAGEDEPATHPPLPNQLGSLVSATGMEWGKKWKDNLRQNWDSGFSIEVQGESLPYEDQFLDLDPTYKDIYGLPLLRVTFDFHDNDYALYRFMAQRSKEIMDRMQPTRSRLTEELEPYNIYQYQSTHNTGGAIMGSDPGSSVTNKYGQVWDTPNVFVTGAALYPQNPGSNPTGTVLALAYWIADALKHKYFRNAEELITS